MISSFIYSILFMLIPIIAIAFLIVSICRYVSAVRKNKEKPDTFSAAEIKKRKTLLIISIIIMSVFAAVVIGLILLSFMAVAFM